MAEDSQGGACVVCCGNKRVRHVTIFKVTCSCLCVCVFCDSFLCSISLLLSDFLSCILNSVL